MRVKLSLPSESVKSVKLVMPANATKTGRANFGRSSDSRQWAFENKFIPFAQFRIFVKLMPPVVSTGQQFHTVRRKHRFHSRVKFSLASMLTSLITPMIRSVITTGNSMRGTISEQGVLFCLCLAWSFIQQQVCLAHTIMEDGLTALVPAVPQMVRWTWQLEAARCPAPQAPE